MIINSHLVKPDMKRLIGLLILAESPHLPANAPSGFKDDSIVQESTIDVLFGIIQPFSTLPGPLVLSVTLALFAIGVMVSLSLLNKRRK